MVWPYGIHEAVGGDHDAPNPGDLLCAALATCLESTVRIIANRMDIPILWMKVEVSARVDVRGTLVVDRETPVGFQSMRCSIHIRPGEGISTSQINRLLSAAEYSCVNLQTLRSGVEIRTSLKPAR